MEAASPSAPSHDQEARDARCLIANRNADRERLMISDGSAGGYTTLCALTHKDDKVFSAGASYYGVSDREALARHSSLAGCDVSRRVAGQFAEPEAVWLTYPKPKRELVTLKRLIFQSAVDDTSRRRLLPYPAHSSSPASTSMRASASKIPRSRNGMTSCSARAAAI
jgi:hypothetical protein